jgi:hypothetical protein
MDNIIVIFQNRNHAKVDKLIKNYKKHYNISGGDLG